MEEVPLERLSWRRWTVAIAVVFLALVAPAARADYVITDLGVLPGGSTSHGSAVNSSGKATGYADLGTLAVHAFLTTAGQPQLTDLGTLGGGSSHGAAINSGGQIVGDADLATGRMQAMITTGPGTIQGISLLSNWVNSYAKGINDSGMIVGYAQLVGGNQHGFFGTVQGLTELGTLGGPNSLAFGVNANGVIVGASDLNQTTTHAFTAVGLNLNDLGGLGSSNFSAGQAINNSHVVVGYGGLIGANHAFRTRADNSLEDLSTLSGTGQSFAYAINNPGNLVGSSSASGGGTHAVLVMAGSSLMIDLNQHLTSGSGWLLNEARGINDFGQIVGTGTIDGASHAFLLTPQAIPEPSGLLLTGLGLFAVGLASKFKGYPGTTRIANSKGQMT